MACTNVLQEPFNSLSAWTLTGSPPPALAAGRNGTAVQFTISTGFAQFTIPAPSESDEVTLGFAWRTDAIATQPTPLSFRSDAGTTLHVRLRVTSAGALEVRRNITTLGTSAAGLIAVNTWYYIEFQTKLHDTTGSATVRLNGTTVLTLTGVDTKNAGTKTVYDTVRLENGTASTVTLIDDLYLLTGSTCAFQGDLGDLGAAAGAGTAAMTFTGSATGTVAAAGAGTAAVAFTGSATGTVTAGFTASTAMTFTAAAVGLKVLDASAPASVSFRAFAQMLARVRMIGTWATPTTTTGPVDLVSGEFTPAPGSLVMVLYGLKVEGVADFLSGALFGGAWWSVNGGVCGAVTDTFAGGLPWHGVATNNHTLIVPVAESWLAGVAYTKASNNPGAGTVTVAPKPHPGHPQYAVMSVVEVRNWVNDLGDVDHEALGAFAVDRFETHHFPDDGAQTVQAASLGTDHNAVTFGVMLSDASDDGPSATDPTWWRGLSARSVAFGVTEGATFRTGLFRMADTDAEAVAPPDYEWSALPLGGYNHLTAAVRIPEATVETPEPAPFAETMIEYQDEFGVWQDITCDARTVDIDAGRQDILEQFKAATLTLTMANFDDVYSGWPPDSVWANAGRYRTDVPVRVNMFTEELAGGVIVRIPHPLFTGTTDSVSDSWPGPGVDAMVAVTASDGFKKLARAEGSKLAAPVGHLEHTGQRIQRWAELASLPAEWDVDLGITRMEASTMEGNALQAMQDTAFADGLGALYMAADGRLTFRQRDALQDDERMTTVHATFTDRHGDPEGACYGDIVPVVDDTTVYNVARFTPHQGAPLQQYVNWDSYAWFGQRTYPQRDLAVHEWNDALAVAILVVVTHADSEKRVESIAVNAGRDPAVWDLACTLELLDRVRVVRHYPGGYLLDEELLIEGIRHHLEGTGTRTPGIWDVTYRTAGALDTAAMCKWDTGAWDSCSWGI